jgi:hypothetical protein
MEQLSNAVVLQEAPTQITCRYRAGAPTRLKCAQCTRPLAVKDARHTPIGYVCPNFIKARTNRFYNAHAGHYAVVICLAFTAGMLLGLGLYLLAASLLFYGILLMTFVGPAAGGVVAEVVRRSVGKARGRRFWLAAASATGIGAALMILGVGGIAWLAGHGHLIAMASACFGVALATSAIVARLRM